jgi:iron-sulfur cluster-binding protein
MKAVIIVFSPSGHTLKIAHMIQKNFEDKGGLADIINITKNNNLLFASKSKKQKILENLLKEFDVLFAGVPVYAGHAESHMLQTLEVMPFPDQKRSKIAVPFITYGGVHSFVALEEMGKILKMRKYVPIMGIKLVALHTLSRFFNNQIEKDRPDNKEKLLIEAAVNKIFEIYSCKEPIKDNSAYFNYTKCPMHFILKILSQERIHKKFKTVQIIKRNCQTCKKCISVCPVNNFIFENGKVSLKNQKDCILCGECFYNCTNNAIYFEYQKVAQKRLKDGNIILEKDISAIYPKKYGVINTKGELCYE